MYMYSNVELLYITRCRRVRSSIPYNILIGNKSHSTSTWRNNGATTTSIPETHYKWQHPTHPLYSPTKHTRRQKIQPTFATHITLYKLITLSHVKQNIQIIHAARVILEQTMIKTEDEQTNTNTSETSSTEAEHRILAQVRAQSSPSSQRFTPLYSLCRTYKHTSSIPNCWTAVGGLSSTCCRWS